MPAGISAVDRNIDYLAMRRGRDQGARLARVSLQETLPLQRREILHDRRLTREAEMFLNLTRAWGEAFALLCLDELQNILLPGSEHMNMFANKSKAATEM
jgi:hypothetical protein